MLYCIAFRSCTIQNLHDFPSPCVSVFHHRFYFAHLNSSAFCYLLALPTVGQPILAFLCSSFLYIFDYSLISHSEWPNHLSRLISNSSSIDVSFNTSTITVFLIPSLLVHPPSFLRNLISAALILFLFLLNSVQALLSYISEGLGPFLFFQKCIFEPVVYLPT